MDKNIKKAIKVVYDYLAISDKPQKVDAIFLATSFSLNPAKKAAEFYLKGYSKYIVMVGIEGTFSDYSWKEGQLETYKKELLKYGIPENAIIVEPLATNSLEEARKSIPLMKKNRVNPKKVIIVDRPEHQRREWATFAKHWPKIKFINCPGDKPLKYNQRTLDLLAAEVERLEKYTQRGDIIPQKVPKEVAFALNFLKPMVKVRF